jgi:phosphopantothenoylcysteine synthetase/decarboxylase
MAADSRRRVILCGTGSVASINLPGCAFELAHSTGCDVRVVVTPHALKFTTTTALRAMSGSRVWRDDFVDDTDSGVAPHVELTNTAALVVVYPATANFIAKIAQGFADDLASAVVLCAGCRVLVVPNMHMRMWRNPATQANIRTLTARHIVVLKPKLGNVSALMPPGVCVAVESVVDAAQALLGSPQDGAQARASSE